MSPSCISLPSWAFRPKVRGPIVPTRRSPKRLPNRLRRCRVHRSCLFPVHALISRLDRLDDLDRVLALTDTVLAPKQRDVFRTQRDDGRHVDRDDVAGLVLVVVCLWLFVLCVVVAL